MNTPEVQPDVKSRTRQRLEDDMVSTSSHYSGSAYSASRVRNQAPVKVFNLTKLKRKISDI
jgi:hypothetical protein